MKKNIFIGICRLLFRFFHLCWGEKAGCWMLKILNVTHRPQRFFVSKFKTVDSSRSITEKIPRCWFWCRNRCFLVPDCKGTQFRQVQAIFGNADRTRLGWPVCQAKLRNPADSTWCISLQGFPTFPPKCQMMSLQTVRPLQPLF